MKSTKKRTPIAVWCLLLSFLCLSSVIGCNDDNTTNEIPNDWISDLPNSLEFDVKGGDKELPLVLSEGVDAAHVACILSEENRLWCNVKLEKNTLSVSVSPSGFARSAAVILVYDKDHKSVVYINQKSDFSSYFTDESCSVLKPGITDAEIASIPHEKMRELAVALKKGEYDTEFRAADYRPYQHPSIMAAKNKTSKYSLRDNPTGIYAEEGDELFIYLGKVYEGAQISMIIQDLNGGYGNSQTIALNEGLNRVIAPIGGLIYILNNVEEDIPLLLEAEEAVKAAAAKTIKTHFIFGKVNGYFDIRKHKTQAKWEEILGNATYQDIDVLGDYSHITWSVDQFRGNNVQSNQGVVTDIVRTIENCDRLVYLEQEFLGLIKYNKMFKNRMHFCLDYTAESPNASDYRTVYSKGTSYAEIFCNPDKFGARLWGPAHEVGHCNQTRPGLKWAGMTEVTNNLTALYVQTSFGQSCKLQVDKGDPKDEDGKGLPNYSSLKNFYEVSTAYIIDKGRAHCLPGIDINSRETQLVPFWQLKLYIVDALGQKDFYHDLYEYIRNNPSPSEEKKNAGLDQLDFVRQVCRISGLNLLDFFEKWGFLKSVNTTLNDYGNKIFTLTQNQVNTLKEEIEKAGYAMPAPNVHEITDETWESFKK